MTALPAPRADRTRGRKGYSLGTWINLISREPRMYALTLRGLLVHPAYGAFVLHKNGLWSLDKVARWKSVKEDQAPNFALPKRYLSLVLKIRHGRVKGARAFECRWSGFETGIHHWQYSHYILWLVVSIQWDNIWKAHLIRRGNTTVIQ